MLKHSRLTRKHVLYLLPILLVFFYCNIGTAQTTDPDQQRREMEQKYERRAQQRSDALFGGKPPAGTAKVFGRAVVYSIDRGFGNSLALQREKQLLAERPAFLGPLPRQIRDLFEENYIPGWNSWRPGQGVPDNQKKGKRNRRPFPINEDTGPDQ